MEKIVNIATLIVLLGGASLVIAAEPITGAFGFKLGDVFNNSDALKRTVKSSGDVRYEVKASLPHKSFQTYEVGVTADLKKIHSIYASGTFTSKAAAMAEFGLVKTELEAKYGPAKPTKIEGSAFFISGGKSLMLFVIEAGASTVFLNFVCDDLELAKLPEKEAAPSVPASGGFEGAFGFKFGDAFNPSDALEVRKTAVGSQYVVKATKTNPAFSEYFLFITPKTHRIAAVWARGECADLTEAKKKRAELLAVLTTKYGEVNEKVSDEKIKVILVEEGFISIRAMELPSKQGVILIIYHNNSLIKQRELEEKEEAAGKADKSGL